MKPGPKPRFSKEEKRKRHIEAGKRWRERNAGKVKKYRDAYNKKYYQLTREKRIIYAKEYHKANRERILGEMKRRGKERRKTDKLLAFQMLARYRGDELPRCRIDLTPTTPVSDLSCRGALQIDHLNGSNGEIGGADLCRLIVRKERSLEDLRLLCQLHQLWNQIR